MQACLVISDRMEGDLKVEFNKLCKDMKGSLTAPFYTFSIHNFISVCFFLFAVKKPRHWFDDIEVKQFDGYSVF